MTRRSIGLFLAAEVILYAAFLVLDLMALTGPGVWLKYIAILLCLTFSLVSARRGGDVLVFLALTLTALADVLLLVADFGYAVGILLFLGAQFLYLIRLRLRGAPLAWLLRMMLPLLLGMLLFELRLASPLNLLACLYFSQLLVNAALSWTLPNRRFFAPGLTLFVCCDLCVALFNAPNLLPALTGFIRIGMWLFYLPSQVLIALSALPKKEGT